MYKIYIGLPIYKSIEPECERTLNEICYSGSKIYQITDFEKRRGSPNIYMQRYNLAQNFLKSDADYFLYFDTDQTLEKPREAIERMLLADKDIISPIIVRRFFPHIPAFISLERAKLLHQGKDVDSLEDFRKYGDKPFEVYYSCGGVVLIRRAVLAEVKNPFYPELNDSGELMSVDYSLYKKARKKGFKCWIHPKIICGHIGRYEFTVADYYALLDSGDLNVRKIEGKKYEYSIDRG